MINRTSSSHNVKRSTNPVISHADAASAITDIVIQYKGNNTKINEEAQKVREYFFNQWKFKKSMGINILEIKK